MHVPRPLADKLPCPALSAHALLAQYTQCCHKTTSAPRHIAALQLTGTLRPASPANKHTRPAARTRSGLNGGTASTPLQHGPSLRRSPNIAQTLHVHLRLTQQTQARTLPHTPTCMVMTSRKGGGTGATQGSLTAMLCVHAQPKRPRHSHRAASAQHSWHAAASLPTHA